MNQVNDDAKYCNMCGNSKFEIGQRKKKGEKKGIKIAIWLGFFLILILAVVLLNKTINNPINNLIECFESADYITAKELYEEKIERNRKIEEQAYKEICTYVSEQEKLFVDGEIAYDTVIGRLQAVKNSGIIGNSVRATIEKVEELNDARIYYIEAESAYEKKDYETAMELYSIASKYEFENTNDAIEKMATVSVLYRTDTIEEVKQCMEQHSYQQASLIINNALEKLGEDTELLLVKDECAKAEYEYTIQLLIEESETYVSRLDYVGALECIDIHIASYPAEVKLLQVKERYLGEFEDYIVNESMLLAQGMEYEQAISLIKIGLKYFSSIQLEQLFDVYTSHIPVLLGDMEIFLNNTDGGSSLSAGGKTIKVDTYSEDNYSNKYEHSFYAGCGSVEYLTNYKYQTFTGTVAFPKGLDSDSFRTSASLYIYGDGQVIASFKEVNETSKPESFSLDIKNYEKIVLKWVSHGLNIWQNWGDFATIFDGSFMPVPIELPNA